MEAHFYSTQRPCYNGPAGIECWVGVSNRGFHGSSDPFLIADIPADLLDADENRFLASDFAAKYIEQATTNMREEFNLAVIDMQVNG